MMIISAVAVKMAMNLCWKWQQGIAVLVTFLCFLGFNALFSVKSFKAVSYLTCLWCYYLQHVMTLHIADNVLIYVCTLMKNSRDEDFHTLRQLWHHLDLSLQCQITNRRLYRLSYQERPSISVIAILDCFFDSHHCNETCMLRMI